MNKIKNILLGFTLVCAFSSCEDELLTKVNPNFPTNESKWESESDFEQAMNAVYSSMQFQAVSGKGLVPFMLRSDFGGTESWYSGALEFANLAWNDGTTNVEDRWSQLYIGIYRANQVLKYIETADFFTEEDKVFYIAQARFLRGLNYFWLAQSYEEVVIQTSIAETTEDFYKELSPRETAIQEVCIPDFEYAAQHLPSEYSEQYDKGRFTNGAASAMLGKIYLYDSNYASALPYFKEIIDSEVYELVPNFMDNFTVDNEHNQESILEVAYSDNYKEGASGSVTDDISSLSVSGSEATSIASDFASVINAGGYNSCMPTYWLQELFVSGDSIDISNPINNEMRYSQRVYASIVVEFGDGDYYKAPLSNNDPSGVASKANFNYGQGSKVKKWTQWDRVDAEDTNTGSRTGINFRHIRYADILLMYAECLLETKGEAAVDEAIGLIDQVRERSGVLTLTKYKEMYGGKIPKLDKSRFAYELTEHEIVEVTAENVMHHIRMVERPLELAFEGHRWFDLVRWNSGSSAYAFDIKSLYETRYSEQQKLVDALYDENGDMTTEKIFPLYLNERVRPDWTVRSSSYQSSIHNYYPVPSVEIQTNSAL